MHRRSRYRTLRGPQRLDERQLLAATLAPLLGDNLTSSGNTPVGWVQAPNQVHNTSGGFTQAAYFITTDPEGDFAYVAGTDSNLVTAYRLDPTTGGFLLEASTNRPLQEITQNASVPGLSKFVRPHSMAISPDGQHAYVVTQGADADGVAAALVTFDRNATTGQLTARNETFVADSATGAQTHAPSLLGAAEIRLSADGRFVYVTGRNSDQVSVFRRETASGSNFGRLTFLQATSDSNPSTPDLYRGLSLSPDQNFVYVTARDSNRLYVFQRATGGTQEGTLTLFQTVETAFLVPPVPNFRTLDGPTNLVVSPDGAHVYVANVDHDTSTSPGERGSISLFKRKADDTLEFVANYRDGVGIMDGLDGSFNLAMSPDGTTLFSTGHTDRVGIANLPANPTGDVGAIVSFSRNATDGTLTFNDVERRKLRGGTFSGVNFAGGTGSRTNVSHALEETGFKQGDLVEINSSPDHYDGAQRVTDVISNSVFQIRNQFVQQSTTGQFRPVQSEMRGALGIAVSPDGRFVYTANYGAPAQFRRLQDNLFGDEGSLAAFRVADDHEIFVTTTADTGASGSLRFAIDKANQRANSSNPGGVVDSIIFVLPTGAVLEVDPTKGALPLVTESVTIVAAGAILDGFGLTGATGLRFASGTSAAQTFTLDDIEVRDFTVGIDVGSTAGGAPADHLAVTNSKVHGTTAGGIRALGPSTVVATDTLLWDVGGQQAMIAGGAAGSVLLTATAGTNVVLAGTFTGAASSAYDVQIFAYDHLAGQPTLVRTLANLSTDAVGKLALNETFTGTSLADKVFFVSFTQKTGSGGPAIETTDLLHTGFQGPAFAGVRGQPLPYTFQAPTLAGTGSNLTWTIDWGDRKGSIAALADGGSGTTQVTSNFHRVKVGDTVVVTNTANHNGTFTVTEIVSNNAFKINKTFVSAESSGNWTKVEIVTGQGPTLTREHVFHDETARWTSGSPFFGGYQVTATVGDGTTAYSPVGMAQTRSILEYELQPQGSVTNFVYGGTEPDGVVTPPATIPFDGTDQLHTFMSGTNLALAKYIIDGATTTQYVFVSAASITGRLIVFMQGGYSNVYIGYFLSDIRQEIHGGDSLDLLVGGDKNDTLFGYGGDDTLMGAFASSSDVADTLYGGDGDDVLYGFRGADKLYGEGGQDLLWGGSVNLLEFNQDWFTVSSEWALNPAAYQERVDAILDIVFGDIEETGTQFVDDAQTDQLFGGEGLDWFISFLFDQVAGTWTEVKDRETVAGTLEIISP